MNRNLEMCRKSLLSYLESKRHVFPRLLFLSTEDVFNVVCSGKCNLIFFLMSFEFYLWLLCYISDPFYGVQKNYH